MTKKSATPIIAVISILIVCVIVCIGFEIKIGIKNNVSNNNVPGQVSVKNDKDKKNKDKNQTEETTESITNENGEYFVTSTAKIGSAGDILIHKPILEGAYSSSTKTYDFNDIFGAVKNEINSCDYFVANLEVTCGGTEKSYSTYPRFNIPDTIVDAAKNAGIDCLMTSNNHCYDSGESGVLRTQQVVREAGLDHFGSVENSADKKYFVKSVKGIKIGMTCFTYETDSESGTALNGLLMTETAASLVNSFNYHTLDKFYTTVQSQLNAMKQSGADITVVYLHWGDEYHLEPNSYQKAMAQKLADMGVDVIIGGHPHVVQPVDLITSTDGTHSTVCVYSMGNFVSNQRRSYMPIKDGHTEDGIIVEMTVSKLSNGDARVDNIEIVPTYVNLHSVSGKKVYSITPLKGDFKSNAAALSLNSSSEISSAEGSAQRTKALCDAGTSKANAYLSEEARKSVMVTQPTEAVSETASVSYSEATQ